MRSMIVLALLLSTAAACSKSKPASTLGTATSTGSDKASGVRTQPQAGTATVTPTGPGSERAPDFGLVYFEFDASTLSADARGKLDRMGEWLVAHPTRLTIEGHADDRGTTEYNIALGQRRAQIIADFLQRLGVPAGSLDTISYGEERPAVDGESESAWAQNRRGAVVPR